MSNAIKVQETEIDPANVQNIEYDFNRSKGITAIVHLKQGEPLRFHIPTEGTWDDNPLHHEIVALGNALPPSPED